MHLSMMASLLLWAFAPEASDTTNNPTNMAVESIFAAFILAPPCGWIALDRRLREGYREK
jgi:hypothetical protein